MTMTAEIPSKLRREKRPPPNESQKKNNIDALCRAIDTIANAWKDANEAAAARGYAVQSPGPRAAAGVVKHDPLDPLHTRTQPGASGGNSAFGDQTGNEAVRYIPDPGKSPPMTAQRWLSDVRGCLKLLLAMTSTDSDDRWSGPFDPSAMRQSLNDAASDAVRLWPANVALLIARIHVLANVARTEWPPTPKAGAVIATPEGDIIVGKRTKTGVTCEGCGKYASGDASDPVARIDGKPYHRKPGPDHGACYFSTRRGKAGK